MATAEQYDAAIAATEAEKQKYLDMQAELQAKIDNITPEAAVAEATATLQKTLPCATTGTTHDALLSQIYMCLRSMNDVMVKERLVADPAYVPLDDGYITPPV